MRISSLVALLTVALASVSAHTTMKNPLPRGHPLNPNAAVKDDSCITAPLNGGSGCGPKPFPCGGYPADTQITQVLTAGEVINVAFWNPNFPNGPTPDRASDNQARHNGGLCEFALSYDGGNTYTVIGAYHKTCPDIYFDWPIKIPDNAPNCDSPGKCLFSWSWINAVGNHEFYQNCADVKIKGNSTKPLPIKDITRANIPGVFPNIVTPDGDPANTGNAEGSGPFKNDIKINLDGQKYTPTNKPTSSIETSTNSGSIQFSTSSNYFRFSTTISGTFTATPTSISGSCSVNGEMKCVDELNFTTCANGVLVTRQCSTGTVCIQNDDSIICGYPSTTSTPISIESTPTTEPTVPGPPASSSALNEGSCSINGEMKCVDQSSFTTCANGVLVTRQCSTGTTCIQNDDSIVCGYPTRKF